jgi:hypothetical protein
MAERKRPTAPLSKEEISKSLDDIEPDEFLERFDEIFSGDDGGPATFEELASLDDYMERELRDMFRSIVAQYITPVERAIARVRAGEQTKRAASEGVNAIAPILSAAESLKNEEVAALLRAIERPLRALAGGARRRLTKKDDAALEEAWARLGAHLGVAAPVEPAPLPVGLDAIARALDGVTPDDVRRLHGAGVSSLEQIAGAPVGDLVAVTGIERAIAERIRAFAAGALASPAPGRKRRETPPGWMRVRIESDVLKAKLTFEYAGLGRYLEPIAARLAERLAEPIAEPFGEPSGRPATNPARRQTATRRTKRETKGTKG